VAHCVAQSRWSNVSRQPFLRCLGWLAVKKRDSRLKGRSSLVAQRRLQHGNRIDRSSGVFGARRRWMGIFAVAPLAKLPCKCISVLLDPICGPQGGSLNLKIDR
jgi:hypothetical protein